MSLVWIPALREAVGKKEYLQKVMYSQGKWCLKLNFFYLHFLLVQDHTVDEWLAQEGFHLYIKGDSITTWREDFIMEKLKCWLSLSSSL